MRHPKEQVYSAVEIRHEGLTLKKTKKVVSNAFKIPIKAVSSVWRWCKRFAKDDKQTIYGLSDLLHVDETEIELYDGEKAWWWGVKDPATKKFVATHVSKTRNLASARFLFWEARRRFPVGYWPKVIRTDGWPGYRRAIFEVFGPEVKHDKFLSFKSHSNNEIENAWRMKKWFPRFRDIEFGRIHTRHVISEFNAEKDKFLTSLSYVYAKLSSLFIRQNFLYSGGQLREGLSAFSKLPNKPDFYASDSGQIN